MKTMHHVAPHTDDLMRTSRVARALGLSENGVRRLVRVGQLLPALTLEGGMRLFLRGDVEQLRQARAESPR